MTTKPSLLINDEINVNLGITYDIIHIENMLVVETPHKMLR